MVEPPAALELPKNRERQHDAYVNLRRSFSPAQVVAEWREYTPKLVAAYRAMREKPVSEEEVAVYVVGTYKKHQFANALAFRRARAPLTPSSHRWARSGGRSRSRRGAGELRRGADDGGPSPDAGHGVEHVDHDVTIELTGVGGFTWTVGPGLRRRRAGGAPRRLRRSS